MNIPTNNGEEWKQIPEWPTYFVSNQGRIFSSSRSKLRKLTVDDRGRPTVILRAKERNRRSNVSRLMLLAFAPRQDASGLDAAHNDGNHANNVLTNLRWATKTENQADRTIHGTDNFGERNPCVRLTAFAVRIIRRCLALKMSQKSLAAWFGVSRRQISNIKTGRKWARA